MLYSYNECEDEHIPRFDGIRISIQLIQLNHTIKPTDVIQHHQHFLNLRIDNIYHYLLHDNFSYY
jgi:hypothetical protein